MNIEIIHESLVNGNRKQMVEQIDEYGLYDFWSDYKQYLENHYSYTGPLKSPGLESQIDLFTDAVISYHRIKNR